MVRYRWSETSRGATMTRSIEDCALPPHHTAVSGKARLAAPHGRRRRSSRATVGSGRRTRRVAGAYSLEEGASVRSRSRHSRRRVCPSLPVARQARIVSAAPRRNGHGRADRGGAPGRRASAGSSRHTCGRAGRRDDAATAASDRLHDGSAALTSLAGMVPGTRDGRQIHLASRPRPGRYTVCCLSCAAIWARIERRVSTPRSRPSSSVLIAAGPHPRSMSRISNGSGRDTSTSPRVTSAIPCPPLSLATLGAFKHRAIDGLPAGGKMTA